MSLIQDKRLELGFSQVKLAEAIGVSQAMISLYEAHQHLPRPEVMPKLAAALGVSVADLRTDYDSAHNHNGTNHDAA